MSRRQAALMAAAAITSTMTACASTGATWRSGVGDAYLERAPWYAGAAVVPGSAIAHVPIVFQSRSFGDPSGTANSEVAALVWEMNDYLTGLGATTRIDVTAGTAAGTPPDVQFGCERLPDDDCEHGEERMRLAVGRPSRTWTAWADSAAHRSGAEYVLVLTLEVGNYRPRQRNLLGAKEIELGTGYRVDVPWLTALDRPVSVLQLTGALVARDGRAVRIGAEGLLARRTNIVLSGMGAQALISDEDVRQLRTARRSDLAGQPLVWQAALGSMVAQLTGSARLRT